MLPTKKSWKTSGAKDTPEPVVGNRASTSAATGPRASTGPEEEEGADRASTAEAPKRVESGLSAMGSPDCWGVGRGANGQSGQKVSSLTRHRKRTINAGSRVHGEYGALRASQRQIRSDPAPFRANIIVESLKQVFFLDPRLLLRCVTWSVSGGVGGSGAVKGSSGVSSVGGSGSSGMGRQRAGGRRRGSGARWAAGSFVAHARPGFGAGTCSGCEVSMRMRVAAVPGFVASAGPVIGCVRPVTSTWAPDVVPSFDVKEPAVGQVSHSAAGRARKCKAHG